MHFKKNGVTINIINDGQDRYDHGTKTIFWDPNSALAVKDPYDAIPSTGIQSPALGLLHEAAHATDPNFIRNLNTKNVAYGNDAEACAGNIEASVAEDLGEPIRHDHDAAGYPTTANPTTHTNNDNIWEQDSPWGTTEYGGQWGGGVPIYTPIYGSGGCVEVSSYLPSGVEAGDVAIGVTLELSDEKTLETGTGIISFSQRKQADGYRITTESGVSLVCSSTAPIPTREGLVLTPNLLNLDVAIRIDNAGTSLIRWDLVTNIEKIGKIEVQHITVGDKCFWAGERKGSYILHHNIKIEDPGWEDRLTTPEPRPENDIEPSKDNAPAIIIGENGSHWLDGALIR